MQLDMYWILLNCHPSAGVQWFPEVLTEQSTAMVDEYVHKQRMGLLELAVWKSDMSYSHAMVYWWDDSGLLCDERLVASRMESEQECNAKLERDWDHSSSGSPIHGLGHPEATFEHELGLLASNQNVS
jgi:hypothetical protein